ncbi:MAG: hypothetical protein J2P58_10430 [Acidimicrobiaceae bacterium]|nr:hypothetical protein [Acidimicrobiaceae bacterium]
MLFRKDPWADERAPEGQGELSTAPIPDPFHYGDLQKEIGATLYRGVVEERGQQFSAFSGTLTFDEGQQVVGVADVVADGEPLQPGTGVVERVNEVSTQMADAPVDYLLQSLAVEVDEGLVQVRPSYVVPPG